MGTPIFLVGFMGSGKSTTGKLLAKKTGFTFIDLDAAIELVAGKSIQSIFEMHGEPAFRKLEQQVLQQLKGRTDIIVATGGGCAAQLDNLSFMKGNGITIFLKAQAGVLFHRLAPQKSKRPLISQLTDVELMEFILETLPVREFYYQKADFTIDAEASPEEAVESIIKELHYQSFSGLTARNS